MILALGFGGGQAAAKTFLPLDPCKHVTKTTDPNAFSPAMILQPMMSFQINVLAQPAAFARRSETCRVTLSVSTGSVQKSSACIPLA